MAMNLQHSWTKTYNQMWNLAMRNPISGNRTNYSFLSAKVKRILIQSMGNKETQSIVESSTGGFVQNPIVNFHINAITVMVNMVFMLVTRKVTRKILHMHLLQNNSNSGKN